MVLMRVGMVPKIDCFALHKCRLQELVAAAKEAIRGAKRKLEEVKAEAHVQVADGMR
jgi:hypothetical protein